MSKQGKVMVTVSREEFFLGRGCSTVFQTFSSLTIRYLIGISTRTARS